MARSAASTRLGSLLASSSIRASSYTSHQFCVGMAARLLRSATAAQLRWDQGSVLNPPSMGLAVRAKTSCRSRYTLPAFDCQLRLSWTGKLALSSLAEVSPHSDSSLE